MMPTLKSLIEFFLSRRAHQLIEIEMVRELVPLLLDC